VRLVGVNPQRLAFCTDVFEAFPLQRNNNNKPQPNKEAKKQMLNWSYILEQLPEEISAELGKAVKFVLWHFISRREVALIGFGHLDTVRSK